MKLNGTIALDVGVHNADIMRYYLAISAPSTARGKLHEKVRKNTASPGPGGFLRPLVC